MIDMEDSIGDIGSIAEKTIRSAGARLFFDGDIIGDYKVISLLGMGSMGQAYRVENIQMLKHYSCKVLPSALASNRMFIKRFRKDVRKLSDMRHKNIVSLHYFGKEEHRNLYYIITDFIKAPKNRANNLYDYLNKKGKLSERETLSIIIKICEAMKYSHALKPEGLLHGALKPSNILLDKNGNPLITDYGLMLITGGEYAHTLMEKSIFRSKQSIGDAATKNEQYTNEANYFYLSLIETREYMAPEVQDRKPPTPQSDVFSIGKILYYMLTGKRAKGRWHLPSHYGCSAAWDDIVEIAMALELSKRYPTVNSLLNACKEISLDSLSHSQEIISNDSLRQINNLSSYIVKDINASDFEKGRELYRKFINAKARSFGAMNGFFLRHPLVERHDSVIAAPIESALKIEIRWIREVRSNIIKIIPGPPKPGEEPLGEKTPFDQWELDSLYSGTWEPKTEKIKCIPAYNSARCTRCKNEKRLSCPVCAGKKQLTCPECNGEAAKWNFKKCKKCRRSGTVMCNTCSGTGEVQCPECAGTGIITKYRIVTVDYLSENRIDIRSANNPGIKIDDPLPQNANGTIIYEEIYKGKLPAIIHHYNNNLSQELSLLSNRTVKELEGKLVKVKIKVEQIPRIRLYVQSKRFSFQIDLCGYNYVMQPLGRFPLSYVRIGALILIMLFAIVLVFGSIYLTN